MRSKRDAQHDDDEFPVNQSSSVAQRQRKIKKFIRKIGNNPNNTLRNTSQTNDKINKKHSNNDNTHDEINQKSNQKLVDPVSVAVTTTTAAVNPLKPNRRRIVVPIRRTRVHPSSSPSPNLAETQPASSTQSNDSSNGSTINRQILSTEQKKKLFVKRRRITPKPLIEIESSITETQRHLSLETASLAELATPVLSLELQTQLSTVQRTFTYVVTRVHDKQSEIISSTLVRDQIKTLINTITHTIHATDIQPTETLKIANTSNV